MKRLPFLLFSLAAPLALFAQGLQFADGNWKSVLAKAAAQKKLVYVDVSASWCGPCKQLAATIFPQKAAGDKYNALFVNYRIDAEKGEGVELAQRYGVTGYPTHLFVNPANGALVYRSVGYTGKVEDFLHDADVAAQEAREPASWEQYEARFRKGERGKAFLKAYLQRSRRLGINNDSAVNAYFAGLKGKYAPEDLAVLEDNLMTLDNRAYPVLAQRWETLYPESREGRYRLAAGLLEPTFQKAVSTRNEVLLGDVVTAAKRYSEDGERLALYYPTEFYGKTDHIERTKAAMIDEAAYYLQRPPERYRADDEEAAGEQVAAVEAAQKAAHTSPDQTDANVRRIKSTDPSVLHPVSTAAAGRLNSLAWMAYERYEDDPAVITQALEWSRRSLDFFREGLPPASIPAWPLYADTYAHLLYVSGDKAGAIRTEKEALQLAKGKEEIEAIEQELEKMNQGTL